MNDFAAILRGTLRANRPTSWCSSTAWASVSASCWPSSAASRASTASCARGRSGEVRRRAPSPSRRSTATPPSSSTPCGSRGCSRPTSKRSSATKRGAPSPTRRRTGSSKSPRARHSSPAPRPSPRRRGRRAARRRREDRRDLARCSPLCRGPADRRRARPLGAPLRLQPPAAHAALETPAARRRLGARLPGLRHRRTGRHAPLPSLDGVRALPGLALLEGPRTKRRPSSPPRGRCTSSM